MRKYPMTNRFNALDIHDAANNARDIRGAYMAQSLKSRSVSLSSVVKAALGALAVKAPLAGHRS